MKTLITILLFLLSFNYCSSQINLDEGLIAYYPFSGNPHDASGNDYHGIIYGATLTADKDGNPNNAFQFNGIDSYIEVQDSPDLRLGLDFSISLWALVDEFSNANTHSFLSKRDWVDNDGYMFQIIGHSHIHDEPQGRVGFIAGSENPRIDSESLMNEGEWFHVVLQSSFSENKSQIFINGKLETEGSPIIPNNQTSDNLYIGKDKLTEDPIFQCCDGFHFNGALDEIRFYNRILNEEEIIALFEKVNSTTTIIEPQISIYPNPTSNYFIVDDETQMINKINMRTINGRLVFSESQIRKEINLPYLESGIYLIELIGNEGNTIKIEKLILTGNLKP